ncbi:hypothetical protein A2U01_0022962, partial [Trifolium medium]|nr:hypothetical protein [Trifolium medium]
DTGTPTLAPFDPEPERTLRQRLRAARRRAAMEDQNQPRRTMGDYCKRTDTDIMNFKQHDTETLCEAYERFKLLKRKRLSQEDHPNGHCIPEGVSEEEKAKYMGRPNPHNGWRENPKYQGAQQHRKLSPLEEAFNQFVKLSQANFENMQATAVNQGASIKNLKNQIGQLSKLITNLSKDYACNTVDNPKKETCKAIGERRKSIVENRGDKKDEKREKDEMELRQFQKWFKQLGMTLEEAYEEFMGELEDYYAKMKE